MLMYFSLHILNLTVGHCDKILMEIVLVTWTIISLNIWSVMYWYKMGLLAWATNQCLNEITPCRPKVVGCPDVMAFPRILTLFVLIILIIISSIMLHNTVHSILLPLSLIFNSSLLTGIFPSDWTNSNIVPIPKSKITSSSSPSDSLPIFLLSIPSKILEHHIFYLYNFCCTYNILSNCQFGFRPTFSIETVLLSNVNSWFCSLDLKRRVCAVFFDLTKAFASVPYNPLLYSLSSLSLPFLLLSWLYTNEAVLYK